MSKALTLTQSTSADETAHFADMFNKFFDVVNVCNFDDAGSHSKLPTDVAPIFG